MIDNFYISRLFVNSSELQLHLSYSKHLIVCSYTVNATISENVIRNHNQMMHDLERRINNFENWNFCPRQGHKQLEPTYATCLAFDKETVKWQPDRNIYVLIRCPPDTEIFKSAKNSYNLCGRHELIGFYIQWSKKFDIGTNLFACLLVSKRCAMKQAMSHAAILKMCTRLHLNVAV